MLVTSKCISPQCNRTFNLHASRYLHRDYCSNQCFVNDQFRRGTQIICEQCDEQFSAPEEPKRNRKYCSRGCADAAGAQRSGHYKACPECGVTFYSVPSQNSTFCSKSCRHRGDWDTSSCHICGRNWQHPPSQSPKYCSQKCMGAGRGRRASNKVVCKNCGKEHVRKNYELNKGKKYCSHQCFFEDKKVPHGRSDLDGGYTDLDVARQWYRQNGECFWCGRQCGDTPETHKFEVDHLTPISRKDAGATHWPRNLVISCKTCNAAKNDRLPIEYKLYRLRVKGSEKTYSLGSTPREKQLSIPIS